MSSLEIDDSSIDQLQLWISSGKPSGMPENLIQYLQMLELVRSMYDKYAQKKFIIRTLSLPPWSLSEFKAQKVFAQALNFFYANNEIKREAWAQVYADKFDKLAMLAIEMDDLQTAHRCIADASRLRMGKESDTGIPKELLDRRPVFYTLTPKDVGLPGANRVKLAQFIDSLEDISGEDRLRLHREGSTPSASGNVFDIETSDIDFIHDK